MNNRQQSVLKSVAETLDAPIQALPLLPEWFEPLTALGSQPRRAVKCLREAGVGRGAHVLDLGCGKGAVAVSVADRLGCHVTGVDAFEPFIKSANAYAKHRRVSARCELRCEPIEQWRRAKRTFDAVLMLGVWHLKRAAPLLRRLTRERGYYLLDDVVLHDAATPDARHRNTLTKSAARDLFVSFGDRIVCEKYFSATETRRHEIALFDRLQHQATRMAKRNPHQRKILDVCLQRQRAAIEEMTGAMRPALWLVRRG